MEALRAGVPCLDAVAMLGSGQTEIEDRFLDLLGTTREGRASGMLIGGGFGSGKSHLLEHLMRLALDEGFAVSRVVISKETPLHDRAKVFSAAADCAVVAGGSGPAIAGAAAALDVDGRGFAELLRWSLSPAAGLNERFAATLSLYGKIRDLDPEFAEKLVRFWSGDPISVPDLRRRLKAAGEGPVALSPVSAKDLAEQRLRFAARLFTAAGGAGWLFLFDEVELVGRYSLLQRAKSYAEIARWVQGDHQVPGLPVAAVLAMTDDFEAAVITGKKDRENVPARLRDRQTPDALALSNRAQAGMRIIDREMTLLTPPDAAELDRAYGRLKELHGTAFGWNPPDIAGLERLGATRMRQYIRAWINEWDLVRLDPAFQPDTVAVQMDSDYREDVDLEGIPEEA
ncbi:BREX system ATP-binding domain-containing protein [Micromonospora sp. ATA51]|uniref:BREX system ATP-binding domain-containing protein n=1 Tax=Micromonospora sp. ATA51 TaxID=2806098 RepID=UPI002816881F|nr:BREX system ATP-binding domain-containing protein [Micromonospora sp. ATA51]